MRRCFVLAIFSALCFLPSVLLGQIFIWVDEQGIKHYSDEPPPEGATIIKKVEEISGAPGEGEAQAAPGQENGPDQGEPETEGSAPLETAEPSESTGPIPGAAPESTCYLEAPLENDVYVVVYDEDGEGNRTDRIWEGKIQAGKKRWIVSSTGRIRYDIRLSADDPAEGDNGAWCNDNETIGAVP